MSTIAVVSSCVKTEGRVAQFADADLRHPRLEKPLRIFNPGPVSML